MQHKANSTRAVWNTVATASRRESCVVKQGPDNATYLFHTHPQTQPFLISHALTFIVFQTALQGTPWPLFCLQWHLSYLTR